MSLGVVLTSLITAFTFRQYCRSTQAKLYFLAASEIITGIFVLSTPFTTSFPLLLLLVSITNLFSVFQDVLEEGEENANAVHY